MINKNKISVEKWWNNLPNDWIEFLKRTNQFNIKKLPTKLNLRWFSPNSYEPVFTLPNLEELYLKPYNNCFPSFNIERIAELTKLKTLSLSSMFIINIGKALKDKPTPSIQIKTLDFLSPLKQLQKLEINIAGYDLFVIDIKALAKLTKLRTLILDDLTEIKSSLSMFESLPNLQELTIKNCDIDSIYFCEYLPKLKALNVSGNNIKELENITNCKCLESFDCSDNKIKSIQNLSKLPKLKELNISDNKIHDISGIEKLSNLSILNVNDNFISTKTILKQTQNIKNLIIK